MKNWEEDDRLGSCPAEQDAKDAQDIAQKIGIKLYTRNFSAEYWDNVFEHFLNEYKIGRTPNPDILCNREIKFKTFLEHADDLGADFIATGHYARNQYKNGHWRLLKGLDDNKDQSYFLYTLGQQQLERTLFPIGDIEKPLVRELAKNNDFITHNKKDSTGICFIGERNFKAFLSQYLPAQPGLIKTPEDVQIGSHDGLMYYTLGQRQGLGIGGVKGRDDSPWYVLNKDMESNTLIVDQGHNHPLLHSTQLLASDIHWISGTDTAFDLDNICAKVRYRQTDQPCRIKRLDDNKLSATFPSAQRAVTPGQSIVFYHNDECLGGGIIESSNALQ